jgi:hypothetical protein
VQINSFPSTRFHRQYTLIRFLIQGRPGQALQGRPGNALQGRPGNALQGRPGQALQGRLPETSLVQDAIASTN